MRKGKFMQVASGSRSASIGKAERAARRSQKRAAKSAAFRVERNEGWR